MKLSIYKLSILNFLLFARIVFGNPADTVQIIDLKGNKINVPAKVNRLAVNGALAQMVLMLGCGERIVATRILCSH